MSQHCPACSSKSVKVKDFTSREGFSISINMCLNCGHYFQPAKNYEDLYTSGEFSKKARESAAPTAEKIKELDKRALERTEFYKNILAKHHSVLEVGSSIGSFLHLLKIMGKEVSGLEPDPVYAAFSENQYFFHQDSDLLESYRTGKSFDLICSFHVIEHIQNLSAFMDKVWSLLQENGALLFECPSLDIHAYGDMKFTIWKPHMHYFTLASMYALVSQKFDVVEIGYYGMSIYVYAKKSNENTYNQRKFSSYKRKSGNTARLVSLTPSLSIPPVSKHKLRQFVLQPLLQKGAQGKLSRYVQLSSFAAKAFFYKKREEGKGKNRATHISYYSGWENAGDTVLSKAVRQVFNTKFHNSWHLKSLKDKVDHNLIQQVNNSRYLLIGGGGVLLPDTNKNRVSGWQWAVSPRQLKDINVPVVIYSIGYNYFRGQQPDEFFIKNLNALIERADFFSLRNYGSIERVKELINKNLHHKIIYQPCPTTVINKFFSVAKKENHSKNVGFNLAFDRYEKRFGKDMYIILDQLAMTAKKLEQRGYNIFCINHLKGDDKFELSLNKFNVKYQSVNLQYTLPQETIDFYRNMEIVLGARGHAQMIPFGVNTRILSLGTHEKLKYFLQDIDQLDWYEDLSHEPERISERLLEKFHNINEKNSESTDQKINMRQEELYRITLSNLEILSNYIK